MKMKIWELAAGKRLYLKAIAVACAVVSGGCANSPGSIPIFDKTPPTTPTNLTATAVSPAQINLSWTASTDKIGVIGYPVERCEGAGCTNFAQIASPAGTTYNDTGLAGSTSYSYRVSAVDSGNNASPYTSPVSATTPAGGGGGSVSVSITPRRGGVTTSQTLSFTATVTNDVGAAGVTWSTTGGTLAGQTMTAASFSSTAAGAFTITATSKADNTKSAAATIGVTDLSGMLTYHNDLSRDGANTREFALTTANVATASFGKLFSCAVDGAVYAQPLWMPNLSIGGGTHNVIFVATQHDSVYAIDADTGSGTTCTQYWKMSLLNGGTPVNPGDTGETGDITEEIGIVGTPVIDPTSSTLYVVSKTLEGSTYHQRLHALSLASGAEKFNGPVDITPAITVSGSGDTGDSSVGCTGAAGSVPFCPLRENQRPGLALAGGSVYVSWASHGDVQPYHGWIMSFSASNLQTAPVVFNDSPNGRQSGIWMAGGAPAFDASNNLYVITGNGDYDNTVSDYGDTMLKLNSALAVQDWFTPNVEAALDSSDLDLGSGGAVVLVDLPSSTVPHVLIGGGKGTNFDGQVYVVNRDNMGQFNANSDSVVQEFSLGSGIFSTPGFWQNTVYIAGVGLNLEAFPISTSNSTLAAQPSSQSAASFGFPGATPSISASNTTNGIVWVIDSSNYGASDSNPTSVAGPAVLHAYDATNLGSELWNSGMGTGNTSGNAVKFTVPTVANGKVYIGTRGNDTTQGSGSVKGELDVYGLMP
ncbi:MAG: fibronectin type III domain-containing protein [Candidatus Acidiferrum sp.]